MDVSPSLTYRDPGAAIDWLERAFGFERGMVVEDGGRIAHAELFHGDSCVMLGAERADGLGQPPGSGWSYVVVGDSDTHHARAKDAGAEIVMELMDTDYGSRDYAARDPEGNLWNFGTYRPSRPQ
jgi:uncharacterized glyoxalase superfamily protein PhnB